MIVLTTVKVKFAQYGGNCDVQSPTFQGQIIEKDRILSTLGGGVIWF